jgi:hypothetical protein
MTNTIYVKSKKYTEHSQNQAQKTELQRNESNNFNKHKPITRLNTKAWCKVPRMERLEASIKSKVKQSTLLEHTLYAWWRPVRPKHVVK